MTTQPNLLTAGTRLALIATLFWVVGCQSGGAPAVASTSKAPEAEAETTKSQPAAEEAKAASQASSPAAPKAAAPAVAPEATPKKVAAASPASAKAAGAPAAKDKKPNFKIATSAAAINVGKKGAAAVSVAPLNGYKWNKEYPAKLIFKAEPKNVKLGKNEFKQMAGDFKIGDKKTEIPVSMKANTVGKETVAGVLKFSICNETACIIEKADIQLAVNVQP